MQIYLNRKQFAAIILPFGIYGAVYLLEDEIFKNADTFFPKAHEYSNEVLSKKVDMYLKIDKEIPPYEEIIELRKKREGYGAEMVRNIFYEEQKSKEHKSAEEKSAAASLLKKEDDLRVEIIFIDQEAAVINGALLKVGEKIMGAKLLDVESNRVLIDNRKGKQWLYMFR